MLRDFLFVFQQLFLEDLVLRVVITARTRACDRAGLNLSLGHPDEHFRRRAYDSGIFEKDTEHVGGRIDLPEGAVDRQGIAPVVRGEALRQDDLEDVAVADVGLGLLDALAEDLLIGLRNKLKGFGVNRCKLWCATGLDLVDDRADF